MPKGKECFDRRFDNSLNAARRKKEKNLFITDNLRSVDESHKRKRSDEPFEKNKKLKSGDDSVRVLPVRRSKSFASCALENLKENENVSKEDVPVKSLCGHCRQPKKQAELSRFYISDFLTSKKEKSILENKELHLFPEDGKAQVKLTSFCVYDEDGHLCKFDNDFIEEGVILFAAGYVKPIHSENPDIIGGVPIRRIGPITSWWIAGFDGGEKAILGISTDIADYYLLKPCQKYEPFLRDAYQKIFMVKLVIEFLKETDDGEATYESLLDKLKVIVPPPGLQSLSEEHLLIHANYIYDLVLSYDSTADSADRLFADTPCMRKLAELAGFSHKERLNKINRQKKSNWIKRNHNMTKAATTNLVENIFECFFLNQMDKSFNDTATKECYILLNESECENLMKCGKDANNEASIIPRDESINNFVDCSVVLEKIDEQLLYNNRKDTWGMPFSIIIEKLSEDMLEKCLAKNESKTAADNVLKKKRNSRNSRSVQFNNSLISWNGDPLMNTENRKYYRSAKISYLEVEVGDFVSTIRQHGSTNYIGRIVYMYEEHENKKFHIHWFTKSAHTVLGETGNSQEIFETYDCNNLSFDEIENKIKVTYLPIPSATWITLGNILLKEWNNSEYEKEKNTFFYQKRFDSSTGRFEDAKPIPKNIKSCSWCINCERSSLLDQSETPIVDEKIDYIQSTDECSYGLVRWKNEEYKIGSCVFLKPGTLFSSIDKNCKEIIKLKHIDENKYPEMYRKLKDRSVEENAEPFNIGYIVSIHSKNYPKFAKDILLTVKKFYRPQDTHLDENTVKLLDLNLLYWSDEESVVSLDKVEGKCYVANETNLPCTVVQWSKEGPYRFYYKEAYHFKEKKFTNAPTTIIRQNEKIVIRRKSNVVKKIIDELPPLWPKISQPLRSLDIFAGCGGLTEGLHQAGVAECHWAIEKEQAAAHAFRLNYPQASVFTEDCNELLKSIMNGQTKKNGQTLPQKGEVELLCGGPPCQGFSGMNRFNDRQYSCFKNSLVVSFLSYVDYFRPRYVIMENVRNFFYFEKSMVLKLTLTCLIKMGYQCTFGIVQAGYLGVPQCRRRAIIMAAAPGEILPDFPYPMNVFTGNRTFLSINDFKFTDNTNSWSSAPYRMLTVFDAISDLPEIESGNLSQLEMSYGSEPKTHFQKIMRKSNGIDCEILRDHICKSLNPITNKRISFIPRTPGSDWRDLPNIIVKLSDGSETKKIVYTHHDIKNGKSKQGNLRGVCSCASGKKCKPKFKQNDTLIPWCLIHTANRHNHWAGLYGRIEWNKYFRTMITTISPICKQGKILHPEQDRILSVREAARSQGFPDRFRFFGDISDKYRQIGNAVPPPLAAALGREIVKVLDVGKHEDE